MVKKRKVFFVPGFDPFLPRRYRELYRKESVKQAEISGFDIQIAGSKNAKGRFGWRVDAQIDGTKTQTDIEVFYWGDIVKKSMDRSIPATFLLMFKTYWVYLSSGALWHMGRLRRGPVLAGCYPPVMLILQLLGSLALAFLVWKICALWLHWSLGFVLGPLLVVWIMRWFKKNDGRFMIYLLLYDYCFSALCWGEYPAEILGRLDKFSDKLAQAMASDVDEVLVIGHSSGVHLAVSVMAKYLRSCSDNDDQPDLAFLSLGHVVPIVSFLPKAGPMRADLSFLSQSENLFWLDVSSKVDFCCFSLCDPVAVSGASPPGDAKRWPIVISAAFKDSLSPEVVKVIRWQLFRLHYQYMCAFDRPRDYDYFKITAGPVTLKDRFEGRSPSKSRIEKAVSPHTGF